MKIERIPTSGPRFRATLTADEVRAALSQYLRANWCDFSKSGLEACDMPPDKGVRVATAVGVAGGGHTEVNFNGSCSEMEVSW